MSIQRAVAIALATTLLAASKPVLADETAPAPSSSPAPQSTTTTTMGTPTARRVLVYSSYGISAVALGLSFVFLAQADSAYGDRREIARQNGSEGQTLWQCRGADECARMKELREDQEAAKGRWAAMVGISASTAIAGTVFLIVHLIDSAKESKGTVGTRLVPAVSPQEAGLRLQGTF